MTLALTWSINFIHLQTVALNTVALTLASAIKSLITTLMELDATYKKFGENRSRGTLNLAQSNPIWRCPPRHTDNQTDHKIPNPYWNGVIIIDLH